MPAFPTFGIDSIATIALARELSSTLQVPVKPKLLQQHNTIASFAAQINRGAANSKALVRVDANTARWSLSPQDKVTDASLCLPMQIGLLSQALANNGQRYVHEIRLRFSSSLDAAQRAFEQVVKAHDVLRLSFHSGVGAHPFVQAVHSDIDSILSACSDVGHAWSADQIREAAAQIVSSEKWPLFRAHWSQKGNEVLLQLVLHHA